MTLRSWGGATGRNFPIQGVNYTCNPMFESVKNGFRPKQAPFNFLRLTYNGEVTKLNWPKVTDIKILRLTFCRYLLLLVGIKPWKMQGNRSVGVATLSIYFLWGEVTCRDLLTWPRVIWVWNFYNICGKDKHNECTKESGAYIRAVVFWKSGKNGVGSQ